MLSHFSRYSLFLWIFSAVCVLETIQVSVNPKIEFVDEEPGEKVAPKIQGVRVIVDAVKSNGARNDDTTEMIKIKTHGAKQTLGVHTDITFEVNETKNDTKKSDGRKAEGEDAEDEEVIIYKGTGDDRNNFNRRHDPSMFRPNLYEINDETVSIGGADSGTWVRFLPSSNGWTTERYTPNGFRQKNRNFIPYQINRFKPCVCPPSEPMWRNVDISRRSFDAPNPPVDVDDKLEHPFKQND